MKLLPKHLPSVEPTPWKLDDGETKGFESGPEPAPELASTAIDPGAIFAARAAHVEFDLAAPFAIVGQSSMPRDAAPALAAGPEGVRPVSDSEITTFSLRNGSPGTGAKEGDASTTALTQVEVDALEAGIDQTLSAIQSNLIAQVFADTLPVLGDNLQAAATGGAAQLNFVTALKDAIVSGLNTLNGAADYTEAQIEGAINGALAGAGIAGAGVILDLSIGPDVMLTFAWPAASRTTVRRRWT